MIISKCIQIIENLLNITDHYEHDEIQKLSGSEQNLREIYSDQNDKIPEWIAKISASLQYKMDQNKSIKFHKFSKIKLSCSPRIYLQFEIYFIYWWFVYNLLIFHGHFPTIPL